MLDHMQDLQDLKSGALEWVNAIRTEHGHEALTDLPRALRKNNTGCTIAVALRSLGDSVSVGNSLAVLKGGESFTRQVPARVRLFIKLFDQGSYPSLDITAKRVFWSRVPDFDCDAADGRSRLEIELVVHGLESRPCTIEVLSSPQVSLEQMLLVAW